jgi:hypothetical protein
LENPELIRIAGEKQVTNFSCGSYHMMAICDSGAVYSWGSGSHGQLGNDNTTDQYSPVEVRVEIHPKFQNLLDDYWDNDQNPIDIREIGCGDRHSIILSTNGYVFTCGSNSNGQLGQKKLNNFPVPTLVYAISNKQIVKVTAGARHSVVLTSAHDVLSTGYNNEGQLGLDGTKDVTEFQWVRSLSERRVSDIFAGGNHTWVTLDSKDPIIHDPRQPPRNLSLQNTPIGHKSHTGDDISYIDEISHYSQSNKPLPRNTPSILQKADADSDENILNVVFTDNEMSHRFARITIANNRKKEFEQRLDQLYSKIEQEDGYVFNKLDTDSELFDLENMTYLGEKSGNGVPRVGANDPNSSSYTLMVINNINKNDSYLEEREKFGNDISDFYNGISNIATPVGQMYQVRESDVRNRECLRYQNLWFRNVLECIGSAAQDIKFLELRPKNPEFN